VAVVLAALSVAGAEQTGRPTGERVYLERCSACHGEHGDGNGPAAAALDPRPQNFRDAAFWKSRTMAQLKQVVLQGKPGTLMAPFEGVLSDEEIDAVVAYLAQFRPATGAGPRDGEVSLTRLREDAARRGDRLPGSVPAL
jgi:mono/diheme cytochrome c family protein